MSTLSRFLPFIFIGVSAIILGTCGDQATGPDETPTESSILVSGALNAVFESPSILANARSHGDFRVMQILVNSESAHDGRSEQAQLMVSFRFEAEGSIPGQGVYTFAAGQIFEAGTFSGSLNYRLREGSCCDDRCSFDCTSMTLFIDSADGNHMRGRFSLAGDQTSGMRIRDGFVEELVLGRDGEIMISGKFDIDVKTG